MKPLKDFLLVPTLLVLTSCATTGNDLSASNKIDKEEYSREVCGYTVLKHNDGSWTIYKNGVELEALSSGYTLQDIKDTYCI